MLVSGGNDGRLCVWTCDDVMLTYEQAKAYERRKEEEKKVRDGDGVLACATWWVRCDVMSFM